MTMTMRIGAVNSILRLCDTRKVNKEGEHHIKLIEAQEGPTKSLEMAEQQFQSIAFL